jgi:hypothetical protein
LTPAIALALAIAVIAAARYVQFRRTLDRLEEKIRKLRELAATPVEYHPVTMPGIEHAIAVADLSLVDRELADAGLAVLGDAMSSRDPQPTRWFADADGGAFGWAGVLRLRGHLLRVAMVVSRRGESWWFTRRAPSAVSLSRAPFVHPKLLSMHTSMTELVASHRAFAQGPGELARVTSLADAFRELQQMHDDNRAWRDRQPPAELLDHDLRAILGRHYVHLGARLAKRLEPELPVARVV